MLDDLIIHTFFEGTTLKAYKVFGAHLETNNRKKGVRFTVFAPNALSVQVVGDFNNWDGSNHEMELYSDGGIWTIFIPDIKQYDIYKYRIKTKSGALVDRSDPYAFFSELRPATASKVYEVEGYKWKDRKWMKNRSLNYDRPLNIYEANLGSWKLKKEFTEEEDGEFYSYEEMIDKIIPYVKDMGYTHIELMPLTEFPFDGSWGYQATGFYSATSRYGNPKQLMAFIDACHQAEIGVIMDVVPAHFVKDGHGLYQFDGGFVYDYDDINKRYSQWDSIYFDLGKNTVRSFLLGSFDYFATYFHIDGIRVDAVSNLIFYDGNKDKGNNVEAMEFIKRLNTHFKAEHPSLMVIAEDSTDYPKVTAPVDDGGLGFDYKWDLGWMNDTLKYFQMDPVYRKSCHNSLTFSMAYFYTERFLLEFSHDEVVHGKATILQKMWGLHDDKIAQVKSLYLYMMVHPGKKLNFMGNEIAEYVEFNEKKSLGWDILNYPDHNNVHEFLKALNHLYLKHPALFEQDFAYNGFEWLVVDDAEQSVFAIQRTDKKGNQLVAVMNFIGNTHEVYTIPVSKPGSYKEIINTDDFKYSGKGMTNPRSIKTKKAKKVDGLKKDYYFNCKIGSFASMIFEFKPSK